MSFLRDFIIDRYSYSLVFDGKSKEWIRKQGKHQLTITNNIQPLLKITSLDTSQQVIVSTVIFNLISRFTF